MFGLIGHTLTQLRGAFGQGYSVDFNTSECPGISGSKGVTLRAPARSVNNFRVEGIIAVGQGETNYDGTLIERAVDLNIALSVKISTLGDHNQEQAVQTLGEMLTTIRNLFRPPLCLAFLHPISVLTTTEDYNYGYSVGHEHQINLSNITVTPPGWWAGAVDKPAKDGYTSPPEGLKFDLSIGPFIQYIDTATEA